jgi:3'(2'), 5'-bisphosphate nucleotidase
VPRFDLAAYAAILQDMTGLGNAAAETIRNARAENDVRTKADGSPVTGADEAAEAVIREGLARLGLPLPVVSEEQADRERASIAAPSFILVDPLDGTREFIAGRDEYTVNIGVVADGAPVAGVIVAPALRTLWRGIVGRGAERLKFSADGTSAPEPIRTRTRGQHSGHGEPIAPRRAHGDLPQTLARRAAGGVGFRAEILPRSRGRR